MKILISASFNHIVCHYCNTIVLILNLNTVYIFDCCKDFLINILLLFRCLSGFQSLDDLLYARTVKRVTLCIKNDLAILYIRQSFGFFPWKFT